MQKHAEEVIGRMKDLLQKQTRVVLAIDGTSAALKSTLADYLAKELNGTVIHCDDFFLPMSLRCEARYQEPGGNIHYERMKAEVIEKLTCNCENDGEDPTFDYMRYDCAKGELNGPRTVPDVQLRIVEGAYALHPYFGKYYDFSIFLTVDEQVQMERIERRNPNPQMFREKWIPLEKNYFDAFEIASKADCILDTTDWK